MDRLDVCAFCMVAKLTYFVRFIFYERLMFGKPHLGCLHDEHIKRTTER